MNLSIFAKPFRLHSDGHLTRVSSIIRGEQIASYLSAKLNPLEGYENDVCIYVKPHIKPGRDFKFQGKPYLDIIDGVLLKEILKKHPEVAAIVCSSWDLKLLSRWLHHKNKIVLIPQHHCNFERLIRNRNGITTVGCIGTSAAFTWLPEGLEEGLKNIGVDLLKFSSFFSRQDIVDFYQKIDVQIVWRPYIRHLANPLKLVNAASFGIPTIALDEVTFKEMGDCYIPVNNLGEFMTQLKRLMSSPALYSQYSQKCLDKSAAYHVDNVAPLYRELCTT